MGAKRGHKHWGTLGYCASLACPESSITRRTAARACLQPAPLLTRGTRVMDSALPCARRARSAHGHCRAAGTACIGTTAPSCSAEFYSGMTLSCAHCSFARVRVRARVSFVCACACACACALALLAWRACACGGVTEFPLAVAGRRVVVEARRAHASSGHDDAAWSLAAAWHGSAAGHGRAARHGHASSWHGDVRPAAAHDGHGQGWAARDGAARNGAARNGAAGNGAAGDGTAGWRAAGHRPEVRGKNVYFVCKLVDALRPAAS